VNRKGAWQNLCQWGAVPCFRGAGGPWDLRKVHGSFSFKILRVNARLNARFRPSFRAIFTQYETDNLRYCPGTRGFSFTLYRSRSNSGGSGLHQAQGRPSPIARYEPPKASIPLSPARFPRAGWRRPLRNSQVPGLCKGSGPPSVAEFFGHWKHPMTLDYQYFALSGFTHRTPPSTSPVRLGINWEWNRGIVCPLLPPRRSHQG